MVEPSDFKYAIDEIDALHVVKVSNNGSIESNLRDAPSAWRTFQYRCPKQTALLRKLKVGKNRTNLSSVKLGSS